MEIKGRLDYALEYVPNCSRLLDIGCDYADFTESYLKKAKKVYAVDPNRRVIAEARKRHKKIIFGAAPAEKLPFGDSFFDVVVLTDVFEHVQDEKKTLQEAYRVLRPGGIMVFSVPNKGLFRFIDAFNMKFYFPGLYRWFKGKSYDPGIYKEAPWHRHYSLDELKRSFEGSFRIEKYHRAGLFIWPVFWLIDASLYWKLFKTTPAPLKKAHNLISDIDYSIPYGPAAYHIILRAKSLKKR
jgi:ubiquinone/menaquinone biosynthesis C-methylase UbiE